MRVSRSRTSTFLASLVVAAGSLLATAGPANAATVDQVCVGTWAVSYNPPITNTPRLVAGSLSGYFPTCTNLEAFNGSYFQAFTDTVSCTALLPAGSASRTFVWGNPVAQPSTFAYNWTVTRVGGQSIITNTGQITSGKFAPDSAEQVTALVTPDTLQCAGSGITTLTGPTTLTIFRP